MTDVSLPLAPWETARKKRAITASATQITNKRRCRRLWWFDKVRRLPQPSGKPQVFGTVLHAVAERYLRADDLGRDSNGDPVNLYPDGWHIAMDRFDPKKVEGEISPSEQAQVMKLITAAIENGVLERRKDRGVEREFRNVVLEHDGVTVSIVGFIDLEHVGEIQDHKTTAAMKWAQSPKKLRENVQMLIYAHQHLVYLKERGAAMPEFVNLRHNYYCKDWKKPEVRKVEVRVSVAEIEAAWLEVEDDLREMVELRDTVQDGLSEIPDPDKTHDNPCMAYGGCAYQRICSGMETIEAYQSRLDGYANGTYIDPHAQADQPAMHAKPNTKDQDMDFATKLAQIKKNKAHGESAVSAPPTMTPPKLEPAADEGTTAPSVATEVSVAGSSPHVHANTPPWAMAGCKACTGIGFNGKGSPCRICDHNSNTTSEQYDLITNDDGTVTWINKEDPDDCGISPLPDMAAPAKVTEKDAATEPVVAPEVVAELPAPTKKPRKPRKPKADVIDGGAEITATFTLCINCGPIFTTNGAVEVVHLCDLLDDLGKQMLNDMDNAPASFYDINNFDRRDAIRKAGADIAGTLTGKLVVAEMVGTGESDLKAVLDAIRPHASVVLAPNVV